MKVVVNNGQFKLTIPKDIAKARGWGKNTRLRFIESPDGDVLIREIKTSDEGDI